MFKLFAALAVLGISGATVWVRTQEPAKPEAIAYRQGPAPVRQDSPPKWVAFSVPIGNVSRQLPAKLPVRLHILLTGNHFAAGTAFDVVQVPGFTPPFYQWNGSAVLPNGATLEMSLISYPGSFAIEKSLNVPSPLVFGLRCAGSWGGQRRIIIDSPVPLIAHSDPGPDCVGGAPLITDGNQGNPKILSPLLGVQITE